MGGNEISDASSNSFREWVSVSCSYRYWIRFRCSLKQMHRDQMIHYLSREKYYTYKRMSTNILLNNEKIKIYSTTHNQTEANF